MQDSTKIESHRAAERLFSRTADLYERRAETREYSLISWCFARRKEVVLSLLDETGASGTLLDYGMGPGVYAREIADRGFRYVGVDISAEMIEKAEALGVEGAKFVLGDLDALRDHAATADVVLAIGLIDYVEDPVEALRKLVACLKPGGSIIVSYRPQWSLNTLMRDSARALWKRLFGKTKRFRKDSGFVSDARDRAFGFRAQLRPELLAMGIDDIRVRHFQFTPIFINVPIPRPVWRFWLAVDRIVAGPWTQWCCAGAVFSGRKRGRT